MANPAESSSTIQQSIQQTEATIKSSRLCSIITTLVLTILALSVGAVGGWMIYQNWGVNAILSYSGIALCGIAAFTLLFTAIQGCRSYKARSVSYMRIEAFRKGEDQDLIELLMQPECKGRLESMKSLSESNTKLLLTKVDEVTTPLEAHHQEIAQGLASRLTCLGGHTWNNAALAVEVMRHLPNDGAGAFHFTAALIEKAWENSPPAVMKKAAALAPHLKGNNLQIFADFCKNKKPTPVQVEPAITGISDLEHFIAFYPLVWDFAPEACMVKSKDYLAAMTSEQFTAFVTFFNDKLPANQELTQVQGQIGEILAQHLNRLSENFAWKPKLAEKIMLSLPELIEDSKQLANLFGIASQNHEGPLSWELLAVLKKYPGSLDGVRAEHMFQLYQAEADKKAFITQYATHPQAGALRSLIINSYTDVTTMPEDIWALLATYPANPAETVPPAKMGLLIRRLPPAAQGAFIDAQAPVYKLALVANALAFWEKQTACDSIILKYLAGFPDGTAAVGNTAFRYALFKVMSKPQKEACYDACDATKRKALLRDHIEDAQRAAETIEVIAAKNPNCGADVAQLVAESAQLVAESAQKTQRISADQYLQFIRSQSGLHAEFFGTFNALDLASLIKHPSNQNGTYDALFLFILSGVSPQKASGVLRNGLSDHPRKELLLGALCQQARGTKISEEHSTLIKRFCTGISAEQLKGWIDVSKPEDAPLYLEAMDADVVMACSVIHKMWSGVKRNPLCFSLMEALRDKINAVETPSENLRKLVKEVAKKEASLKVLNPMPRSTHDWTKFNQIATSK